MIWRLLAVTIFILICYNAPSEHQNLYLELENLRENTYRSLSLCLAISLISVGRAAIAVITIELLLVLCSFYTGFNLSAGGGVFSNSYSEIQQAAYWLELAIMIFYVGIEYFKSGENPDTDIHRAMRSWRTDSTNTGNHH